MRKKDLLFVSPRFLFPTDSGGKIRTTQILRGLKDGRFSIKLLMPATSHERSIYDDEIRKICDELVSWEPIHLPSIIKKMRRAAFLFSAVPMPVRSDWDSRGVRAVRDAVASGVDVVVFDFPHSTILAPDEIAPPTLLFTHNVESEIFHRHWQVATFGPYKYMWRSQYEKMTHFERQALTAMDGVVAVSERDADFFRHEWGVDHLAAIPTGVDTEFFDYVPPVNDRQVVFCGSMDWIANVDGLEYFFLEVWPLIRQQVADARMRVVGRQPPAKFVRKVTAQAPEWQFTGFVEDVRDHVPGCSAFVIPLRVGGGTRIKAFEAMAMGCPVVSTSIGIEGLPVESGKHFFAADNPEAFAKAVVRLLENPDERHSISVAARQLVESRYSFRRASEVFEQICMDVIDRSNRSASNES